jgi:MFS family permease
LIVGFLMLLVGSGTVYYAYGNFAVAFAEEFHASRSVINVGFTVVGVLGNLGSAPVGILADRWPIRRLAAFGVIGTALGLFLVSLATNIWQVVGLFSTLIALADICLGTVVTNYIVSHWFERRRGFAIGLSVLGASAAAIIFPPLTNFLISDFGWRTAFVVYAVATFALLPLVWIFARTPDQVPAVEAVPKSIGRSGPVLPLKAILSSRAFWVISLAIGTMVGANTGTIVSMVGFAGTRSLTTGEGSALLSVLGICAMAGKISFGIASDRISHRRALQFGIFLQGLGLLALPMSGSFAVMLASTGVMGLGLGAMLPVWGAALAAQFGLRNYGRVMGLSRLVMTPLSMMYPIYAGFVFDRTGEYDLAWYGFSATLAAALLLTTLWSQSPTGSKLSPLATDLGTA